MFSMGVDAQLMNAILLFLTCSFYSCFTPGSLSFPVEMREADFYILILLVIALLHGLLYLMGPLKEGGTETLSLYYPSLTITVIVLILCLVSDSTSSISKLLSVMHWGTID